jgi:hypothetical protein
MKLRIILAEVAILISGGLFCQSGEELFEANCSICHSHEKVMTGPPITYISEYKDFDWFFEFLQAPYSFWEADNDTYTTQMLQYYYPIYALHPPSKLDETELKLIWDYIIEIEQTVEKHNQTDSLRQSWNK